MLVRWLMFPSFFLFTSCQRHHDSIPLHLSSWFARNGSWGAYSGAARRKGCGCEGWIAWNLTLDLIRICYYWVVCSNRGSWKRFIVPLRGYFGNLHLGPSVNCFFLVNRSLSGSVVILLLHSSFILEEKLFALVSSFYPKTISFIWISIQI